MNKQVVIFDNREIALVYATGGVTLDFVKNPNATVDPEVFASRVADLQVIDSPMQLLETSLEMDGSAQNLDYLLPLAINAYEAGPLHLIGVEIAIQLNALNIPASDLSLELQLFDAFGEQIESVTNLITGNAAILNGNTRQYVRILFSEQFSTANSGGTASRKDGQIIYMPKIGRMSDDNLTALLAGLGGLSAAAVGEMFYAASGERTVSKIRIAVAANKFTSGVILTAVPIVIGRVDVASSMVAAIENMTGSDAEAFIDRSNIINKK